MPTHLKTQLTHATSKQILINNSITTSQVTTTPQVWQQKITRVSYNIYIKLEKAER